MSDAEEVKKIAETLTQEQIRKNLFAEVKRVRGELRDEYQKRLYNVSPFIRAAALTAWGAGFDCAVALFTAPGATEEAKNAPST